MPILIGGWYAHKIPEPEDSLVINIYTYGSTPEESVAKLLYHPEKNGHYGVWVSSMDISFKQSLLSQEVGGGILEITMSRTF
jgi:hypothetical protein